MFSIIITHYNQLELVKKTIESVQGQSYSHWEMVLVDDGSSPDVVENLGQYTLKDKRIKFVAQENGGACKARNKGLEYASGDYIMFLDGDDVISKNCFEQRIQLIENHPNADFVVSQGAIFYETPGDDSRLITTETPKGNHLHQFLQLDVPWVNFGPTWRKSSLDKFRLRWSEEVKVYQDVDFHLRALLLGMKYEQHIAEPNAFWRWGLQGNTGAKRFKPEMVESNVKFWKSMKEKIIGTEYATEKNLNAIRRHLFELVLFFLRKDNLKQAEQNIVCLRNFDALDTSDLGLLENIMASKKMMFPLNRLYFSFLYRTKIRDFHQYGRKYFGTSLWD